MPAFPKPNPTETDPVAGPNLTTHAALTTTAHGGIVASNDARLTDGRVDSTARASAATAQSTADGAVVLAETMVPKSDIDTDSTFAANSDTKVPSQKAVKAALAAIDLTSLVVLAPGTAARNTIQPSADVVPLTVKAKSGQTARLMEFQDSAGTVQSYVSSNGTILAGGSGLFVNTVQSLTATGAYVLLANYGGASIINRTTTSNVVLTVKGMASQSGNLQEWQDSSGTVLTKVESGGALSAGGPGVRSPYYQGVSVGAGTYIDTTGGGMTFINRGTAQGVIFKGVASQAADLTQWQDSAGTILARVSASGIVQAPYVTGSANTGPYLQFTGATAVKVINRDAAGNVPLVVQGMASQSGNLQEWQSSAGTVLASISSSGVLRSGYLTNLAGNGPYLTMGANNILALNTTTVSNVVFTVTGMASQSGDLQRWTDSTPTTLTKITSTGQIEIAAAGVGIKLKSPDGLTTKTLTIDNAGALALA